jgi:biotin transport system substrate-specific component
MKKQNALTKSAFIALFAAFISIACFIAIPTGAAGIPIVLQNMIAILAGLILGGVSGAAAVALFMLFGVLGFPVFSGGRSGIAPFLAPAGGYLVGYFFAAFFSGLIAGKPKISRPNRSDYLKILIAASIGFALIYIFGTARLVFVIMNGENLPFIKSLKFALTAGVLPYLLGDIIKLLILVPLAVKLRPIAASYLASNTSLKEK